MSTVQPWNLEYLHVATIFVEGPPAEMNLLLFEAEELSEDRVLRIDSERATYLREIQGVQPGFQLRVGQINGPQGQAEVREVMNDAVVLEVGPLMPSPPTMNIALILGMPRPQSLKKVLETIATYGVQQLQLTGASRVQKSYFDSKVLRQEQLERHLRLGLSQGIGTALPDVRLARQLRDISLPAAEHRLLATPEADRGLAELRLQSSLKSSSRVVLAVGPEGGWSEREIRWFTEQGFSPFHMGKRVLRVETAVCSLLAQLLLLQQLAGNK